MFIIIHQKRFGVMFRRVFRYDDATFSSRSTSVMRNGNSSGGQPSLPGPLGQMLSVCSAALV